MTQLKTFEEQFPSLKDWVIQSDLSTTLFPSPNRDEMKWVSGIKIKEHCLDKQKVRDAFDKYLLKAHWQVLDKQKEAITKELYEEIIRNFEKELGL